MLKKCLKVLLKILYFVGILFTLVLTVEVSTWLTSILRYPITEVLNDSEFSFRDYPNTEAGEAEVMQARLYELHPVGSGVGQLLYTLEEAGAVLEFEEDYIHYKYKELNWSFWYYGWNVMIKHDGENRIVSIKPYRFADVP